MPSPLSHVKKLKALLLEAQVEADEQERVRAVKRRNKPFEGYKMNVSYYRLASFGKFMKRYEGNWQIEVWARDVDEAKDVAQDYIEQRYMVWGTFSFEGIHKTKAVDVSTAKTPGVHHVEGRCW